MYEAWEQWSKVFEILQQLQFQAFLQQLFSRMVYAMVQLFGYSGITRRNEKGGS